MSQEQPPPTQPVRPPDPPERRPQQPPQPQQAQPGPWTGPQPSLHPAPAGQPGQPGQQGEWRGGTPYPPYAPPQQGWQQPPSPGYPGAYAGPPGSQPGPQAGPHAGPQAGFPPSYQPGQQAPPAARDQTTTWRTILQIACPVLMVIALAVAENGRRGYTDWTLWAVFATVAALVQLAPLVLKGDPQRSWTTCAVGVAALLGYWVVIVLPGIDTNVGFLQTLAIAGAAVGCWLSPGRRI